MAILPTNESGEDWRQGRHTCPVGISITQIAEVATLCDIALKTRRLIHGLRPSSPASGCPGELATDAIGEAIVADLKIAVNQLC